MRRPAALAVRAARHAALGEPVRLAIVEELRTSDRSPAELCALVDVPSNLLAHHLDVLEGAGLVHRTRSTGDRRRRYVRLRHEVLADLVEPRSAAVGRALFVCSASSARSQLAAALWRRRTGQPALAAGTHPAARIHPGAVAAARRGGLDLDPAAVIPLHVDDVAPLPRLVITVCDQAHEALEPTAAWLHWSVPDPVPAGTRAAFDHARDDLEQRIELLLGTGAAAL